MDDQQSIEELFADIKTLHQQTETYMKNASRLFKNTPKTTTDVAASNSSNPHYQYLKQWTNELRRFKEQYFST
ncbi:hypothetical protein GF367_00965 [Candidatus Woesearchaeota archaeon]|nr:hypothetical protein [Candidatus Woesearchaeota archaeon]